MIAGKSQQILQKSRSSIPTLRTCTLIRWETQKIVSFKYNKITKTKSRIGKNVNNPILVNDIENVIKNLSMNKGPGPDGLTV